MDDRNRTYRSPLETRWASGAMRELLSPQKKHSTWRRLWLALAEAQHELGLSAITEDHLEAMREHLDDIDFAAADAYEAKFRHDVMAHIHAFGDVVGEARATIHLGATSQFVNCNTDMIVMREAMRLLRRRLLNVIDALATFAAEHRDLPCLAFTHFQPAQATTVGKRAALWCAEFLRDLRDLEYRLDGLEFRGVKGTTGTQASYLALFNGDHEKVRQLERRVAEKMGFERIATITGQTYSRKVDAAIAQVLAGLAASVHKFCNDVRLLAHRKEMDEPFGKTQVGSSAMAYKRNPMRCERATGLARYLMDVSVSPLHTAAEQVKLHGKPNDLIDRLAGDEAFAGVDLDALLDPRDFTGRSAQQVDEFLADEVAPVRARCAELLGDDSELRV